MKLIEIIDQRKLEDDEIYTTAIACEVEPKQASTILEKFCILLPLQQYGLGHLKRMRRYENDKGNTLLEILVCPEKYFEQIPLELLNYCNKKNIVKVSKIPALNKNEFEEFGRIWPSSYRPNLIERDRENGPTQEHIDNVKKYMKLVKEDTIRSEMELKKSNNGGIIINPVNGMVVMTSTNAYLHLKNIKGEKTLFNPIYTTAMICIEGVSAMVRGEIDSNGILPEDYYLCTGLDLYLHMEPDLMTSMALVHSRIRNVYFLNESFNDGALKTFYKLHSLRSLNHKFRVFHVIED
jgi:tRNA-specific adenosine deaminase 3